jgi:hypothetical protein
MLFISHLQKQGTFFWLEIICPQNVDLQPKILEEKGFKKDCKKGFHFLTQFA